MTQIQCKNNKCLGLTKYIPKQNSTILPPSLIFYYYLVQEQMKEDLNIETEFLGTVFDRQVRIEDWNQKLISSHTALCLGVGGLGSVVIMNLLRLGIKKIILVDYDKVDVHNLNRQIMFSFKDVGESKVKSCIKNAEFHNVGNTELIGVEADVLLEWQKIVQLAREADVVFNMIDYGDWFDLACQSMAIKLKIPMIQGGTFATSMTVDYYSPESKPCALCLNPMKDNEFLAKIMPDNILELDNLKFLPKNNNPVGRSFIGVCTICGEYMVCLYLNSILFNDRKVVPTSRMIFYTNTFEMVNFPLQREKGCQFCGGGQEEQVKETEEKQKAKEEEKPAETQKGQDDATNQSSNDCTQAQPKQQQENAQPQDNQLAPAAPPAV